MLAKKASVVTQVLTEDTVIPLVVDVQVQLLHRCQSSTVTKPPDSRTVIWTRDAGDDTRGQTKLAHQRGESTLQAISCSSLQWIGSPSGRPLGSEKADHISQMGRIGEWGDLPMSLLFRMTKNSRAGFVLSWLHRAVGLEYSLQTTSLTSWTTNNRFIIGICKLLADKTSTLNSALSLSSMKCFSIFQLFFGLFFMTNKFIALVYSYCSQQLNF